MNSRCQLLRHRLDTLERQGACLPRELRAHVASCPDCVAWLARRSPTCAAGLLLARVTAPAELEGRVVAALHAGHREDRASRWLRDGFEPLRAPAELEWRVTGELSATGAGRRAPAELDERLSRDLSDLSGTLVRRYASRLEPQAAPGRLRGRVAAGLARGRRARRLLLATAGLLGFGLLALGTWRAPSRPAADPAPALTRLERPDLDFEVYLAEPAALSLSPLTQALASSVTGGLSDVVAGAAASSRRQPAVRQGGASETHGTQPDGGAPRLEPSVPGGRPSTPTDPGSESFLKKLALAPGSLRYAGQRRVVLADPGSSTTLELHEGVWSDGKGRFRVRLLGEEADAWTGLMHASREGFIQRYRDFRVRDLESFLRSFEVQVLDEDTVVAGRAVVMLEAARRAEPSSRYRVGVDAQTGLVLSYEERRVPTGELLASCVFEELELDPDLDAVELTGGPSRWTEFDPAAPQPASAADWRRPAYVPRHHQLERAARTTAADGNTWYEFVYGDGVEQVFFLHAEPAAENSTSLPGDSVRVSSVGAWTILEGHIGSTPIAVIGKLDLEEVLLLVQSAF